MTPQSLEEIADAIGKTESALRGLIMLGTAMGEYDQDSPSYQFACALEPLANQLAEAYCALLPRATQAARDHGHDGAEP